MSVVDGIITRLQKDPVPKEDLLKLRLVVDELIAAAPVPPAPSDLGTLPDWAVVPDKGRMVGIQLWRQDDLLYTWYLNEKDHYIVGRVEGVDIQVDHDTVSRKQCVIAHHKDGTVMVMDCESAQGTEIDGKFIPPHTWCPWKSGERAFFGMCSDLYVLCVKENTAGAPPPPPPRFPTPAGGAKSATKKVISAPPVASSSAQSDAPPPPPLTNVAEGRGRGRGRVVPAWMKDGTAKRAGDSSDRPPAKKSRWQ